MISLNIRETEITVDSILFKKSKVILFQLYIPLGLACRKCNPSMIGNFWIKKNAYIIDVIQILAFIKHIRRKTTLNSKTASIEPIAVWYDTPNNAILEMLLKFLGTYYFRNA